MNTKISEALALLNSTAPAMDSCAVVVSETGIDESILLITRDAAVALAQSLLESAARIDRGEPVIEDDKIGRLLIQLPGFEQVWISSATVVPNTSLLKETLAGLYEGNSDVLTAIKNDPGLFPRPKET